MIGYARVSKTDGSQSLDLQRDALRAAGTVAGLKAARARGRKGGRKFALLKAQVRLAQAAMAHRDTSVSQLCRELGIRSVTLYRYVGPQGQLREQASVVSPPPAPPPGARRLACSSLPPAGRSACSSSTARSTG